MKVPTKATNGVNSLVYKNTPPVVLPDGLYLILPAVPIFGAAIDTSTYGGLLAVNGYTAEYCGRTVSPYLAAVDVG